jgi:hypothetical protein
MNKTTRFYFLNRPDNSLPKWMLIVPAILLLCACAGSGSPGLSPNASAALGQFTTQLAASQQAGTVSVSPATLANVQTVSNALQTTNTGGADQTAALQAAVSSFSTNPKDQQYVALAGMAIGALQQLNSKQAAQGASPSATQAAQTQLLTALPTVVATVPVTPSTP